MDAAQFAELVKKIEVGKKLPDTIYLHESALDAIPVKLATIINAVGKALKIPTDNWNIVKLSRKSFTMSLLHYPTFFAESYPALTQSVTVDLQKLSHKVTDYSNYDNPPILHRKETMIQRDHPSYDDFCMITQEGEQAGLYENPRHIGFKASWEALINSHGYELVDGRLFRNSALAQTTDDKKISRDKTAIVRYELSSPMKVLAKHGFLEGQYNIFDYGCGRGDDLRELEAHGLDALGWDPNFLPDADKLNADLVNIGFVINVIEDRNERIEALQGAWQLTDKLLVASAMLANESYLAQFTPYKDGIITSRNTFQKYFTQSELKLFIELSLDEQAIAVAPGIYFIFKDKDLEQEYLQNRHRRKHSWEQKSKPIDIKEATTKLLFTKHSELFESFWQACLLLGRCPAADEFAHSAELVEIVGTIKKAFRLCKSFYGANDLLIAQQMRREDLLVYFAVSLFGKRKPYKHQPEQTKRDIKAFFDTNTAAQSEATELLFQIADIEKIEQECIVANETLPASVLDHEYDKPHALTFHKQYLDLLSPLLRVYVSSALQLYGELEDIQLIKIHITSGKLTLLGYEDFETAEQPRLKERVKIKMAEQDVDFFDYLPQTEQIPHSDIASLLPPLS
ncbi:DNA phosphorothioation-associated putative methyltransferase [Paraglaciecola chathamensis]|uniref:DNA phosphorothioation-associated putative methyltransferase n=1 Tax=Paraglaciecola chathamensis TaxID=368405 RepID=A0ABS0WIB2_9ALTE|nr:DNA phosphorothioation-associated putative methyltransferase [Paraglaciecola chathamensis]MBJ2138199.1 DNA phosphorothioation-associated putative methyltransferase [Paraglaciecola chathamensis]